MIDTNFQTPPDVAYYMSNLLPKNVRSVLEPTPGLGNIVKSLEDKGLNVTAPKDYFCLDNNLKFDAVVLNPPFSSKYAFLDNADDNYKTLKGMKLGYQILFYCMKKADIIIALMPWFTISDSDVRMRHIKNFGLKSITVLPRKTFNYARIQTCVIEMEKDYKGKSLFHVYEFLNKK